MPTSQIQSPAQVQSLFDRIAPSYDELNQRLSLGLHRIWKGITVQMACPPRGSQVLDICCGSGDLALLLAQQVGRQGTVVGLDFSEHLLQIARRRSRLTFPGHTFDWILGDALRLPFAADQFTAITMGYGLRNVIDIPQALQEIHRVLKPGSRAAVLDFHRSPYWGVSWFQELYLERIVVPAAARLGVGDEYEYIYPSLETFPTAAEQLALATTVGFDQSHYYPLTGGLMGILLVQKSIPPPLIP
ncbi:MAG: bifunctional demethylmenaquinone methyltransferase/2-methoxy-6-polyprenyl-1,4-benzoquinol methylase UbiE [Synechococcaceae cyanobacterium SM2_3_1]|nr:bifunctional demethylmenaquinone methyltransferase/2-methoxy-6-polyprenyl-1,4-benzoquinol methylase UbiE [Synechococcaceae cyanobacterium SM2_3_1]